MSRRDRTLRASDADRDRVASELRGHAAEGRLTPHEFDERLDAAYAARTLGDLAVLLADLPTTLPAPRSPAREIARRQLAHRAGAGAITVLACVAIWLASGANGSFWPAWVLIAWGLVLARRAWRTLGPASSLRDHQLDEARRTKRRGRDCR